MGRPGKGAEHLQFPGGGIGPNEEHPHRKESFLMPDDTKKKDHPIRKWISWLVLGTVVPAIGGLVLMNSDYFDLPAESWEFMATLCTMVLFIVFHIFEATMGSRRKLEALFDLVTIIAMMLLGLFWLGLIHPHAWIKFPFTLEQRLRYRYYCGVGMFTVILVMNIILWAFWWCKKRKPQPDQNSIDLYIRYHLSVCILDIPTLLSLVVVLVGCHVILTALPAEAIAMFPGLASAGAQPSSEMARLAIASTFYSGAAAFHMMLGNAVFSFIHSGRLHKVIASHSKVKPQQQPAGATP
jgi:hypothetical protein